MNTHITLLELRRYLVTDAWGAFIARYPWEWFVTLTFVEDIHPEAALKVMRVWLSILNRQIFGPRWFKKPPHGLYWVAAIEYQKRGILHLHLLVNGVKDAHRFDSMRLWENLRGKNGFSRVYPVESLKAVSHYLSKYVAKDGEIFLSDNLPDVTSGLAGLWADSPEQNESLPAEAISQVRT